tara:strand:- start:2031 stop:2240 length:210 start_codon:yes stop_codon:yes gene_type:complete
MVVKHLDISNNKMHFLIKQYLVVSGSVHILYEIAKFRLKKYHIEYREIEVVFEVDVVICLLLCGSGGVV